MSESLTVIFTHAYVNKLYLRKFNLLSVLLTDVMVITRINSSATKTKMNINYKYLVLESLHLKNCED